MRICCNVGRCFVHGGRERSHAPEGAAGQTRSSLTAAQVNAAVHVLRAARRPDPGPHAVGAARRRADVSSLAAIAGCRPTVASQHLSKLRFAGLVEGDRHGQRVVYRLRGGHVRALLPKHCSTPTIRSAANPYTTDGAVDNSTQPGCCGLRPGVRPPAAIRTWTRARQRCPAWTGSRVGKGGPMSHDVTRRRPGH